MWLTTKQWSMGRNVTLGLAIKHPAPSPVLPHCSVLQTPVPSSACGVEATELQDSRGSQGKGRQIQESPVDCNPLQAIKGERTKWRIFGLEHLRVYLFRQHSLGHPDTDLMISVHGWGLFLNNQKHQLNLTDKWERGLRKIFRKKW